MYNPISTYRIQFHKDFTIKDLEKQIDYLSLLGIGTLYASPVFAAIPGSEHGYDITNPLVFNPEITTIEEFNTARQLLKKHHIGWMQDIVPNHMAYHTQNAWLMDVLEKGTSSPHSTIFDLEPGVPDKENPLMVPFLGSSLEEAMAQGEIKTGWQNGNFTLNYFDNAWPVSFETFREMVKKSMDDAPNLFSDVWKKFKLGTATPDEKFLNTPWQDAKKELENLYSTDQKTTSFIDSLVKKWNDAENLILEILQMQHYELCHWQETEKRINYRRFFTVNGLICLRMEDKDVFDIYHRYIADMIKQGQFNGLRVDHIDGLHNPNEYLENLRTLVGDQTYIVAEKILEHDEKFPAFWPIQGNTGYDFLAMVNNLLTSVDQVGKLKDLYKGVSRKDVNPSELVYKNKKMILTTRMHGEWDNMVKYFNQMKFIPYDQDEVSHEEIKEAIGKFMLACPVYRLYVSDFPLTGDSRKSVEEIFHTAIDRNPALKKGLEKLSSVLLDNDPAKQQHHQKLKQFFTRLMQFTGPLMAKGVEDTSMYQYHGFIAHNEVGDAINAGGLTIDHYHQQMLFRQQNWPSTMNTTSTHDTKRGEDVRARLNVISELTDEWEENVHDWMQMNQKLKIRLESGLLEPSTSIEYFIYQTLLGTFPFDGKADETYLQRIDQYLVKAMREAKRKVSWRDPDETYENTVCEFARNMLSPKHDFLAAFIPFQQKIAWRGIVNALSQLTLKINSPGIPDIYQGTELWDLTLVDPDNRQPVDFDTRHKDLKKLIKTSQSDDAEWFKKIIEGAEDGRIKLWLTHCLLNERKKNPALFLQGEYMPLKVTGEHKDHILAFARKLNSEWILTIVPLIVASLSNKTGVDFLRTIDWKNTAVVMPREAPSQWKDIIRGVGKKTGEKLILKEWMDYTVPVVLKNE